MATAIRDDRTLVNVLSPPASLREQRSMPRAIAGDEQRTDIEIQSVDKVARCRRVGHGLRDHPGLRAHCIRGASHDIPDRVLGAN